MSIRRFASVLPVMAVALTGCLQTAPSGPQARTYEYDFKGGAGLCEAARVSPSAGKTTDATMKVRSTGGWCGLSVSNGGKPFDAPLLTARAEHGKVVVHSVGNDTRIDYTPDRGYSGPDSFSVTLLPGAAVVKVAVTSVPN